MKKNQLFIITLILFVSLYVAKGLVSSDQVASTLGALLVPTSMAIIYSGMILYSSIKTQRQQKFQPEVTATNKVTLGVFYKLIGFTVAGLIFLFMLITFLVSLPNII